METIILISKLLLIALCVYVALNEKTQQKKYKTYKFEQYRGIKLALMHEQAEIYRKYESPEKVDELLKKLTIFINNCSTEDEVDRFYDYFSRKVSEAILKDFKKDSFKRDNYNKPFYSKNKTQQSLNILGLTANISDFSVIRKQYRELIKKYHPDNLETGNLEKSKEITCAYHELKAIYEK